MTLLINLEPKQQVLTKALLCLPVTALIHSQMRDNDGMRLVRGSCLMHDYTSGAGAAWIK